MRRLKGITRRDFLDGVAAAGLATAGQPIAALASSTVTDDAATKAGYPPALTGLRGSHAGSFEVAHRLALEGARYKQPASRTDRPYDLVVVGAGISGLAAAYLAREKIGHLARILILDNHDDFGGHAKRNEFTVDGKHLIGYGGSQSIDQPAFYSPASSQFMSDMGFRATDFYQHFDAGFYRRFNTGVALHMDAKTFGTETLLRRSSGHNAGALWDYETDTERKDLATFIAGVPLDTKDKVALTRLFVDSDDWLSPMSRDEKIRYLKSSSYEDCLRKHTDLSEKALTLLRNDYVGLWGLGWDALSGLEAVRLSHPGTYGLDLDVDAMPRAYKGDEPYIFHYPDGNAAIARMAVAKLVPGAIDADTMADLVAARVRYDLLDQPENPVRVRLSSTVVDVRNSGGEVDVTYICAGGTVERVTAKHVIMAGYGHMLPYIMPDLSTAQKNALLWPEKVPLTYATVALRNWRAFADAGVNYVYAPAGLFSNYSLDFPVSMGTYQFSASPDQPVLLHMTHCPTRPCLPARDQHRQGRYDMLDLSFDDYEQAIMGQLSGAMGAHGFDGERDIAAITVNRWPHGYAYEYNELFDDDLNPDNGPHIVGRQKIGSIAIAGSDSSAFAYVNGAIDAAARAVGELY